jgi:hypothetical protein
MVGAIPWGLAHEGAVDISVCFTEIDIDSPDVSNQLLGKHRPNILYQHGQYMQFTAKRMRDGVVIGSISAGGGGSLMTAWGAKELARLPSWNSLTLWC